MTQISRGVIADLGATYRQIDFWLTRYGDLLLDDPQRSNPGTGCPRDLTTVEMRRLERMAALVRSGTRAGVAAHMARQPADAELALAWAVGRGEAS